MSRMIILTILLLLCGMAEAQDKKHLFYLHGAIVQHQGAEAVSPEHGPYRYHEILDSFRSNGFIVISEVRPPNTVGVEYAQKVAHQADSLINTGIAAEDIVIVGASAGAFIAVNTAMQLKNKQVRYVLLGMCWQGVEQSFEGIELCGHFLSFYETTDSHGPCRAMFNNKPCVSSFTEVALRLSNGHGFLYRPYNEWLQPLVQWAKSK